MLTSCNTDISTKNIDTDQVILKHKSPPRKNPLNTQYAIVISGHLSISYALLTTNFTLNLFKCFSDPWTLVSVKINLLNIRH